MSHELTARLALEKQGFHFSHALGQNFLLNDRVIARIADEAGVQAGDNILEIGAGAGVLTAEMMDRGAHVLALELDRTLEQVIGQVAPGARVLFQDAMKADIAALTGEAFAGAPFRVVANLPYYITSDILTRLVRLPMPLRDVVVMVQKEAAQRMMAEPGEKAYCLLAATVQLFGAPKVLFEVPPQAFTPPPHVQSVLLRIQKHAHPPVEADEEVLHQVMAACFAMRRKTLQNNLTAAFSLCREEAAQVIEGAGLPEKIRGEMLTLEQMGKVANLLTGGCHKIS